MECIRSQTVEDYEEWMTLRRQEEDQQAFKNALLLVNKQNRKELDLSLMKQGARPLRKMTPRSGLHGSTTKS